MVYSVLILRKGTCNFHCRDERTSYFFSWRTNVSSPSHASVGAYFPYRLPIMLHFRVSRTRLKSLLLLRLTSASLPESNKRSKLLLIFYSWESRTRWSQRARTSEDLIRWSIRSYHIEGPGKFHQLAEHALTEIWKGFNPGNKQFPRNTNSLCTYGFRKGRNRQELLTRHAEDISQMQTVQKQRQVDDTKPCRRLAK